MISAWTKHLKTEEEKERFRNSVLGSKTVLLRLQELINEMKEDVERTELDTRIYDMPNWDYRNADTTGYKRCLKQISKLINLDQQDKK
jgi:hypothetical protein